MYEIYTKFSTFIYKVLDLEKPHPLFPLSVDGNVSTLWEIGMEIFSKISCAIALPANI